MCIETEADLQGLVAAGGVVRRALDAMRAAVRAGITTGELNAIGAGVMRSEGAQSAPIDVYEFPKETCISVNDEVVHGIPSKRVLREGDLVKLDVTAELGGYMADAAETVPVGRVSAQAEALIACAEHAFDQALRVARAGARVCDIGRAVEDEVLKRGFSVVRELQGHGIGRRIHEDPMVPNWYDVTARDWLVDGLVITIEPIIAAGTGEAYEDRDGWTIRTSDASLASHHEHTVVITKGRPRLLTAAA